MGKSDQKHLNSYFWEMLTRKIHEKMGLTNRNQKRIVSFKSALSEEFVLAFQSIFGAEISCVPKLLFFFKFWRKIHCFWEDFGNFSTFFSEVRTNIAWSAMFEIRLCLNDQLCSAYVDRLMKKSNKVHRQERSHFVHYGGSKIFFSIHKIM